MGKMFFVLGSGLMLFIGILMISQHFGIISPPQGHGDLSTVSMVPISMMIFGIGAMVWSKK